MTAKAQETAVLKLRELGTRRVFLRSQLEEADRELADAIVAADQAGVPRRAIGREAGVVRATVYNVLARREAG